MMTSCHGKACRISLHVILGIYRSTVDSTHKAPVMRGFDAYFVVKPDKLLKKSLDADEEN